MANRHCWSADDDEMLRDLLDNDIDNFESSVPPTDSGHSCHGPDTHLTLDQVLALPSRLQLPKLNPELLENPHADGMWFSISLGISGVIRNIIYRDLCGPYPSYTKVPVPVRDRWFKTFAQRFYWERGHHDQVRDEFHKFCTGNFRGYVGEWKRKWKKDPEQMPSWMDGDVKKGYIAYWSTPKSERKSAECSKAKKSEREGDGPGTHTLGSKPMRRLRHQLHKTTGSVPDIVTLLETSRRSKSTGEIVDKKAEKIIGVVKRKAEEIVTQRSQGEGSEICSNQLTPEEIQKIYDETVPMTKGYRFGYGSCAEDAATSSRTHFPPPGYVHEDRLLTTQEELRKTQENWRKTQENYDRLAADLDLMRAALKNRLDLDIPVSRPLEQSSDPTTNPSFPPSGF